MTLQWLQVFTWSTVSLAVVSAVSLAATAPTGEPTRTRAMARAASAPPEAPVRTAARRPLSAVASAGP